MEDSRVTGRAAPITQPLCANAHGFSLHAGVRFAADQRQALEHLCRYITRPAIAHERLSVNRAGQAVLKLKTAYRNGTSHLVMSPLEFMQRLAALVPRPRLHLIRFHGVLAPHAKLRAAIVPIPAQTTPAHAADCAPAQGGSARMNWVRLLKRVFKSVSGGLILERGLVLARADGWDRLALVPACGLRESGGCEGQDSAENSGACVNGHAVDPSPGGR